MNDATISLIVCPALPALDSLTATQSALAQRDELLAKARKGTAIRGPQSAQRCSEFLHQIKAFTRAIEDARSSVKAPVLDVGRRIDAVAADLTRDLEVEAKRIAGLLGAYAAEQKQIEEEARRRAWMEQERIRLEAEAKERAAREAAEKAEREAAEKARAEQAALEAAASRARTEAGRSRREAELKAAQEAAEAARAAREMQEKADAEKRRQEAEAASLRATQAVVPAPQKFAGISTGSNLCFEVTNIVELYESHPMFVLLSPNNAAIKAALKTLPEGTSLPGVRHWREAKAIVR